MVTNNISVEIAAKLLSLLPIEPHQLETCPVTESNLRFDITPVTTSDLFENGTQAAIHSSGILNHWTTTSQAMSTLC